MVEKCPWCDYQSETLAGICNHVRQKHDIKEYQDRGMKVKDIIESKRKADKLRQEEISKELQIQKEKENAKKPEPEAKPAPPIEKLVIEPVKFKIKVPKEERPLKEPEPEATPKERRKMFSLVHPGAYNTAASLLPKMGLFILAGVLIYSAMTNMMAGNYLFVMDWFKATIIGPIILGIFIYPGGPKEWFSDYGVIALIVVMVFVVVMFIFYRMVWRFMFKDYSIVRGQSELREGRVYWWTGNMWTRMWDRYWRTEPRTEHVLYIKQYFWPPFNPLNPRGKLIKLHLSTKENPEYDSLYSITGHERRFRVYIGDNELATTDDAQSGREIPIDSINGIFKDRRELLIGDTQKFSMANPSVRLDLLRDGTYLTPEDFYEPTTPEKTG